jgi:hypothetical protein
VGSAIACHGGISFPVTSALAQEGVLRTLLNTSSRCGTCDVSVLRVQYCAPGQRLAQKRARTSVYCAQHIDKRALSQLGLRAASILWLVRAPVLASMIYLEATRSSFPFTVTSSLQVQRGVIQLLCSTTNGFDAYDCRTCVMGTCNSIAL